MANDNVIPLPLQDQYRSEMRDGIRFVIEDAMEKGILPEEIVGALAFSSTAFQHELLFGTEEGEE